MIQQQQQWRLEAAKWQHYPPDNMNSILPSLPAAIAHATPYGDDKRRHRSAMQPEQLFDGRPATLISSMCQTGTGSWCAIYAGDGFRPIEPLGIRLAVGGRSHMQFGRPASRFAGLRGLSSNTFDYKPHQTSTRALVGDQELKVAITGHGLVERRALSPLSAGEVERRRLCLPTREARRNGPRTVVGKENYHSPQQSIPCGSPH